MSFNGGRNPGGAITGEGAGKPLTWGQINKLLSGEKIPELVPVSHDGIRDGLTVNYVDPVRADGWNPPRRKPTDANSVLKNSSPSQSGTESHGREETCSPVKLGQALAPFAELHAASTYNFLRGASEPEAMITAAMSQGITHLALLDRDGLYGASAYAQAAASIAQQLDHVPNTVFGAELTLSLGILPVICKGPEGYRRLSHAITQAQMAGSKDKVVYPSLAELAQHADGHWYVLANHTWCDHMDELLEAFGEDVVLEYVSALTPQDTDNFEALDAVAQEVERAEHRTPLSILTAMPTAARREDTVLAETKGALNRRESVELAQCEQHPMGGMWLRGAQSLLRGTARGRQDLVDSSLSIAKECAFELKLVSPNLPRWEVPEGHDEQSWLEEIVDKRFDARYRSRDKKVRDKARAQARHEFEVIRTLGFPGYFLIIDDIVSFCRNANILCQGRGSAANSVICFVLGITNVEPISAQLLFERFLSPEREGAPDIDLDIESTRREEVIQYVYSRYGRDNAAQVANLITYRTRGAVRDAARALGYPQGAADAWTKDIAQPPDRVAALGELLHSQPRHLGIHSGGMVICDRPIADVVPIEWARMQDRSVVQWDKEGCAWAGLVKFDLLGLGMLEALHHMIDLVKETTGREINLWEIDTDEKAVYDMLSRADAVGVFQVESRAQLNTLPRMKPSCFFDLVVEVALIRPGPIQGGSVHPYLRRRAGKEKVTFEHPVLKKSLGKTLGVPLFQEQLMQIAVDAAGFTGGQADELRRAMGSKRSPARMAAIKDAFYSGLKETNNITGDVADSLWNKIVAFAAYGFPESHSQSFASLVYFSAWFKYHYPAQFCVGLLRAQPMGFYSPQSLISDARRHGVKIAPIDVQVSDVEATLERSSSAPNAGPTLGPPMGEAPNQRDHPPVIRLGLGLVKGLKNHERIVAGAPYADIADLARRANLSVHDVECLARAGALDSFGVDRRQALWQAGVAATEKESMLPGLSAITAPALPGLNALELMVTDISTTGVTHDEHPMARLREILRERGVVAACDMLGLEDGSRIRVAGVVTHRQRPRTAQGVTFMGLEDETGLINVVISVGLWNKQKTLARTANTLIIRGILRNQNGVAQIDADRLEELPVADWLRTGASRGSRDFR